jgi:serine protease Do
MKTLPLPALLLILSFPTAGMAQPGREDAIKEIDAKIAALQQEKAKLLAVGSPAAASAPATLYDSQGRVSGRVSRSVLIIEGDKGVGTGFVVSTGGKKYLYTAAHVFSGNSRFTIRNAAGTEFKKFGDLQAAEGADLIRLEMWDDPADFLELAAPDAELAINTEIAALGNGGGTGVIAVEQGRILGTSGDILEVDAKIIQGNSGGPVVERATGKVVGEVTHLIDARKDVWSEGTRQGDVRRFACRLNKDWKWMTQKTGAFVTDGKTLAEFDDYTRLCFAIAQLTPLENGMRLTSEVGGDMTAASIFEQNKNSDLVKSLVSMNIELASRKTSLSDAELIKKFVSLLAQAEGRASRTHESLKPASFAWFHRDRAKVSVAARAEAIAALKQRIDNLR